MPTSSAVVKKALSRDMVPPEKPKAARAAKAARGNWPANPYAEDCPTRLVLDRIADKWTVLLLMTLAGGPMRFNALKRRIEGVSQKMLSQTLRQMERDGLVIRTVHPVIPPKVEYRLTDLGFTLAEAFCGVWMWAEKNIDRIEAARAAFDGRKG